MSHIQKNRLKIKCETAESAWYTSRYDNGSVLWLADVSNLLDVTRIFPALVSPKGTKEGLNLLGDEKGLQENEDNRRVIC
jgi:hypothetical protein